MSNVSTEYGLKELESVVIKTTSNIEVGGRIIEANETIAAFDKIKFADFQENAKVTVARGGFNNASRVWWQTVEEVQLRLVQGIFSNDQLALMANAKLINKNQNDPVYLNYREVVESNEDCIINLKYIPVDYIFVYDKITGEKITDYEVVSNQSIKVGIPYHDYLLDYQFRYTERSSTFVIGSQLTNGFLTLIGKTRVKDDITGKNRTGIITIPKLKLMSDISMRLGSDATPIVGELHAFACPVGTKGNESVMELTFLDDLIDDE